MNTTWLTSNRKSSSVLYILSALAIAILTQTFWSWNANKPFHNGDGVFNYSLAFVPESTTEMSFTEEKYGSELARYVTRKVLTVLFLFGTMDWHTIDFLNARKADIDYHINGFTLVESPMEESDWSVQENRERFYTEMEPILKKLHPDIESLFWFDEAFLRRELNGNNEPALYMCHLDYHPDQSLSNTWAGWNVSDFDMILGVWKPDNMETPVVDYPLAFIDGSTFEASQAVPVFGQSEQTLMNGTAEVRRFVSSALNFSPKHKYYYYPEQTTNEVLIFRQYTNENVGTFANPHVSFKVPDSPKNAPSRRSVEMRVGINFKQNVVKTS